MPDSPTSTPPVPLSCRTIADKLGYNTASIWKAIRRLKIAPVMTTPAGYCYYDESVVETLRTKLRPARR